MAAAPPSIRYIASSNGSTGGKGRQHLGHNPASNATCSIDAGSHLKPLFASISRLLLKHPNMALRHPNQRIWCAVKQYFPLVYHDQAVADGLNILNNMGGQQHNLILRRLRKEVAEIDALLRSVLQWVHPDRSFGRSRAWAHLHATLPAGQSADSHLCCSTRFVSK